MSDNELLLAISNMIEPMRNDIQGIKIELQDVKNDVRDMKIDMQGVKDELQGTKDDMQGMKANMRSIKDELHEIKVRVQNLEGDMQDVKEGLHNVENRVKKIELTQENNIVPRLQNIEACYTSTYDRYKTSVEDYDAMKQDISILKNVVTEHSEQLQRIS